MAEQWRQVTIEPYSSLYEVSSMGQFRRTGKGQGAVTGRAVSDKRRNRKGYAVVEFCAEDRKRRFLSHQVVARAFLGDPADGTFVNHKDGNKTNNAVENLEWATPSENMRHAVDTGLLKPMKGEKNGRSKLTTAQVDQIRSMKGVTGQRDIARLFGVARSLVQRIHQGRAWK